MLEDFMEARAERFKIRLVLTCIGVFLVSMVMSCQELRYVAWGKTVDARILRDQVEKESGRYGSTHLRHVVIFTFMDGDLNRQEYDEVPMDWTKPGETIAVQYIVGKENQSRLAGRHHWGWVTVFLASVVAMVGAVWWMVRENN